MVSYIKSRWGMAGTIAALLTCGLAFGQGGNATSVRLGGTIHLPGSKGYVDYLVMAPAGNTLYAGYATENSLYVVDTERTEAVASIGGLKDVRSVALVPEQNAGFTSNRGEDTIGVIDLKSNRLLSKIPGGQGPDAIIYDKAAGIVYVANHEGHSATLIDPATKKVTATVPLGGSAEFAQADSETGRVYQNLEDTNETVVVDPKKKAVIHRFKTAPGKEPTGLAFDAANRRLFCACGNKKLIVMDSETGRVVAAVPIGSGVDSVAYDPGLKRIYTANGESGTMTVIRQDSADGYTVEENVRTHKGAHALAIDPVSHRVYVVHGTTIDIYEPATGRS